MGDFLKPLRHRRFRRLWTANLASNMGTWMQSVGAAWLMTSLTSSALAVASVQTATTLPVLLLALPAGAAADIIDRPRFLFAVQVYMAAAALALGALCLAGRITPAALLLLTFALGAGAAFNMPAWQAAVSGLVDPEELPAAVMLNNLSYNMARAFGPSLAGLLIAVYGASSVFLLNALSFTGLIGLFYAWQREPRRSAASAEEFLPALRRGLSATLASAPFRAILFRAGTVFFSGTALWALLPLIARSRFGCGPAQFGFLMACLGAGAVAAAVALPALRRRFSADELVAAASLLFGAAQLGTAACSSAGQAFGMLLLAGAAWSTLVSTLNTAAQQAFPMSLRARAVSVYLMVFYGAMAAGGLCWGLAADALGLPATLSLASLVLLAGVAAGLKVRLPGSAPIAAA